MNKKITIIFIIVMVLLVVLIIGFLFWNYDKITRKLNSNYLEDIKIIKSANDFAKKWQVDAMVSGVVMVADNYLIPGEYIVVFESKNNEKEKFKVFLKEGVIINTEKEQVQSNKDNGYISIENIKFSSANAFKICKKLAIEKNINTVDYDTDFILSHFKSLNIEGWRYILTDKKSQDFIPSFECVVDAFSGKVLKN